MNMIQIVNLRDKVMRLAIVLGLGVFAATSFAGTVADNLLVTATIVPACTVAVSTPLAFGNYDPLGANSVTDLLSTGVVTVTCAGDLAWALGLDEGLNPAPGSTTAAPLRRMADIDVPSFLDYSIYSDAAHTTVWGNTVATDLDGLGTGAAQANTVYGLVPAGQNPAVAAVMDTVVATLTF